MAYGAYIGTGLFIRELRRLGRSMIYEWRLEELDVHMDSSYDVEIIFA